MHGARNPSCDEVIRDLVATLASKAVWWVDLKNGDIDCDDESIGTSILGLPNLCYRTSANGLLRAIITGVFEIARDDEIVVSMSLKLLRRIADDFQRTFHCRRIVNGPSSSVEFG